MRLINTHSLELEYFIGSDIPQYAILSHTWEKEEVTFQDMSPKSLETKRKRGYTKIEKTCEIARKDGLKYAWIDACCIDKTSSSELTESLNSMFQWYRESEVCYAFLSDLRTDEAMTTGLRKCRWFTRGWTLQELIAPDHLIFFDSKWRKRDERRLLSANLSKITGIPTQVLIPDRTTNLQSTLRDIPIATKMCWARKRETAKIEDIAYCLLGIFDVQMPLLYGEGSNAFRRLQEEIAKKSPDLSLLAWKSKRGFPKYLGVLAPSVDCFEDIPIQPLVAEFAVTNFGLKIHSRALLGLRSESWQSETPNYYLKLGATGNSTDLYLIFTRVDSDTFVRGDSADGGLTVERNFPARRITGAEFYLELDPMQRDVEDRLKKMRKWIRFDVSESLQLIQVLPQTEWEWSNFALKSSNASVLVLSYGALETPVMFLVLCLDWLYLDDVYMVEYSHAATQFILQNLENLQDNELSKHWKLSPAKQLRSEVSTERLFITDINVKGGQLKVELTAAVNPGMFKRNFGIFPIDKISISCSFQSR